MKIYFVCYFVFTLFFLVTNGQQERSGQTQEISTKSLSYPTNTKIIFKNFYPLSSTEPSKENKKYGTSTQSRRKPNLQVLEPPKRGNTKNPQAGESGQNYPTYRVVPKTSFSCAGRAAGYYADLETGCQAFRICAQGLSKPVSSFLCPNGSIFNQATSACDWWRNVNCNTSSQHYSTKAQLATSPITQTSILTTQAFSEQPAYNNYQQNFATLGQQITPELNTVETRTRQPDITPPPHRFVPPKIATETIFSTSSSPTTKTSREAYQNEVTQRTSKPRFQRPDGKYKYSRTEVRPRTQKPLNTGNIYNQQQRRERPSKVFSSFTITTTEPTKPKTATSKSTYKFSFSPPTRSSLLLSQRNLQTTKKQEILTTTSDYNFASPPSTQAQQVQPLPNTLNNLVSQNTFASEPNLSTTSDEPETVPVTYVNNYSLSQLLQREQVTTNAPNNQLNTQNVYTIYQQNLPQQSLPQLIQTNQQTPLQTTFNTITTQNIPTQQTLQNLPITEKASEPNYQQKQNLPQQSLPQLIQTNQQTPLQTTFNTITTQNIPTQQTLQNLPNTEKASEPNYQQQQLDDDQTQIKSSSSEGATESTETKSEAPVNIEKQKILAITSGYNYLLPAYSQTQPPLKYTPAFDFKNSAALLSGYFNTDIRRPQGFQLPSTSSESTAPVTETVTETNSILSSQPELEPEIATTPVPPTTLKLISRSYPTLKPKSQFLTQTPTLPTVISTTENLQNTEGSTSLNSRRGKTRFNQQKLFATTQKPSTTNKYTYSETPLLTTLPLQFPTVPLTTITTLPDANLLNQYSLNQGQLILNNVTPKTLSDSQTTLQQQNQLGLNQGQLLLNNQELFQLQNQAQLLLNNQGALQQQAQQNLNQGQLLLNNQGTLQQHVQQNLNQGQLLLNNQKSVQRQIQENSNQEQLLNKQEEAPQQQDQTLQNGQQTSQQQSQQSSTQGQLLSNKQENLQQQNQLNQNQAQFLVNGQGLLQQQNQQNLNQLQQQSPLSLNQGQLLINNIPQNTFTLPNGQILQQQLNQGQLTFIPQPFVLTTPQTNLQQTQKLNVASKTVTVSNNQGNLPQPQNPPPPAIQKQNSEPAVEIVPSLSFSFETPNERKEFVDAILGGNLFEAPPNKENISLDFINQAVDSFPFRIQQQQQQITTIPQFFTQTTPFLLPQTTLPQILIPQYQLSAVQPTIQPQQVDITQAPLPKTTTTTETSRRKSKFTPRRKQ